MPRISNITKQKKKERFNIFLDGRFSFSVSNYSLLKYNLKVDKTLNNDEIDLITAKEEIGKFTDLAIKFLSIRPRSEKEVRKYLVKKLPKKTKLNSALPKKVR